MQVWRWVWAVMFVSPAGVGAAGIGGCELDDPCDSAKAHLCEKVEGMNCMTEAMGNAVARIRTDCGVEVAESFVPAVKAACQAGNLNSVCR